MVFTFNIVHPNCSRQNRINHLNTCSVGGALTKSLLSLNLFRKKLFHWGYMRYTGMPRGVRQTHQFDCLFSSPHTILQSFTSCRNKHAALIPCLSDNGDVLPKCRLSKISPAYVKGINVASPSCTRRWLDIVDVASMHEAIPVAYLILRVQGPQCHKDSFCRRFCLKKTRTAYLVWRFALLLF